MIDMCIPDIRGSEPMPCDGVAVFPLFAGMPLTQGTSGTLGHALAQDAMAAGTLSVTEVSEEGLVSELLAVNAGDEPVLIVEGQVLRGAKQDRVLCCSVLSAARSQTRLPVACVERGRWDYGSRHFAAGGWCPPTMRHRLKQLACSASSERFVAQASVWHEIRRRHRATATRSERENLCDILDTHRDRAQDLRHALPCSAGASGIAVALNGKVVCADIFDSPTTLARMWERIIDGIVLDSLEVRHTGRHPTAISVEPYKGRVWERAATVGLGEAYRSTGEDGSLATALVADGTLIHMSMAAATSR